MHDAPTVVRPHLRCRIFGGPSLYAFADNQTMILRAWFEVGEIWDRDDVMAHHCNSIR